MGNGKKSVMGGLGVDERGKVAGGEWQVAARWERGHFGNPRQQVTFVTILWPGSDLHFGSVTLSQ